jgi:hypothetical protein
VDDLRADVLGLGLHLLHQPGALDGLGEAGIVLDVRGDGQLAAGLQAGDDHRVQRGASGVDGGGPAGGAGTDDGDADGAGWGFGLGHGSYLGADSRFRDACRSVTLHGGI